MKLYIETENGVAKNHPAFEDNLIQAFGVIPANWEPFSRVEPPVLQKYQVLESDISIYTKVNGIWTDVWSIRDMSAEEKELARQNLIKNAKDLWLARPQVENWSAWIFNEEIIKYEPPIPRPETIEGVDIRWCGADANWKETPPRPEGEYKFDFIAWDWVAI